MRPDPLPPRPVPRSTPAVEDAPAARTTRTSRSRRARRTEPGLDSWVGSHDGQVAHGRALEDLARARAAPRPRRVPRAVRRRVDRGSSRVDGHRGVRASLRATAGSQPCCGRRCALGLRRRRRPAPDARRTPGAPWTAGSSIAARRTCRRCVVARLVQRRARDLPVRVAMVGTWPGRTRHVACDRPARCSWSPPLAGKRLAIGSFREDPRASVGGRIAWRHGGLHRQVHR